jgi:glutamate-1-semialdehyde 2,1-aminomutase
MAAGLATLRVLQRDVGWSALDAKGARLAERLAPGLAAAPQQAQLVRCGSIFWLALQEGEPPRRADALDAGAAQRYAPLFHALLQRGVYLAPSAYEVAFLSMAHEDAHLERLAEALEEALAPPGDAR